MIMMMLTMVMVMMSMSMDNDSGGGWWLNYQNDMRGASPRERAIMGEANAQISFLAVKPQMFF